MIVGIASPLMQPSPDGRKVGIRIVTSQPDVKLPRNIVKGGSHSVELPFI